MFSGREIFPRSRPGWLRMHNEAARRHPLTFLYGNANTQGCGRLKLHVSVISEDSTGKDTGGTRSS
jgi:hypothetical protein